MFQKVTLVKIVFVVSILAVMALAAIAPSVARAFFPQGLSGFASRWVNNPTGVDDESQVFTPEATPTPEANSQFGGSAVDESAAPVAGSQLGSETVQDTFEFVGALTAKEGNLWTVDGVSVQVTAQTELKGMLDIGIKVKVHGALQADGTVIAREIEPAESDDSEDPSTPPSPSKVEFTGEVAEMTGSAWVVNGINVILTERTEIYGSPALGDLVKVEGYLQGDGSVLADEIKPVDFDPNNPGNNPAGKIEFKGILQAKNGNTWMVEGIMVIVTAQTELKGTLAIGEMVEVEGIRLQDGSVEAREIKNANQDAEKSGSSDDDGDDNYSGNGSSDDHSDDDDHDSHDDNYDDHGDDDDHDDDHDDDDDHKGDD